MKRTSYLPLCGLLALTLAAPFRAAAADKAPKYPKPYPQDVCAVSEEKLGSMGEPFVFVHAGQQVKLCCKGCRKDFDKDPAKYLAKLEAAAKKVKKYPGKVCILSGEPLPEEAPASIFKGQEFKFCCEDCQKKFDKDPARYAAKLPKS